MSEWIQEHDSALVALGVVSIVMFVGTLVLVPILVARIPSDYFARPERAHGPWSDHHPVLRVVLLATKNLLGAIFVVVGALLLVLPGQGFLTIVIGVLLLDFPGKFRFERWLVSRRPVLRSINWLRMRTGHDPLALE